MSEYNKLNWLFTNSDHVGYCIRTLYVTGLWKDIIKMMESLDNIPNYIIFQTISEFNIFVNELQYKPNPNRKYRFEYSLNYLKSFEIKRME